MADNMENQVDKDGNDIPHGVLDVAIPRTVGRIVLVTFIVHAYATMLYVYLTGELLPRTRLKPRLVIAELLLVLSVPEFFLVQLLFIPLGTLADELIQYNRWSSPSLVRFARLTSLRSLFTNHHVADVSKRSPCHRMGFHPIFIWGCAVALAAYAERFKISYHASTDCGNLGIDHRNGWVAGFGLLVGTIGVLYRTLVQFQKPGSEELDQVAVGWSSDRTDMHNYENNDESSSVDGSKDEEGDNTGNGDTSLWLSSVSSLPPTATDLSFSTKLTLAEAYIATLIHQLPLAATHRASLLLPYLPLILLFTAASLLVATLGGARASRKAQTLLAVLALVVVVWTVAESIVRDGTELLYDVPQDLVHAWTIRWKSPDRWEKMWRWLV